MPRVQKVSIIQAAVPAARGASRLTSLLPDTAAEPAALSKIEKLRLNSKVPAVKKLTQEDIDSGRYTIHDVLLPLPGFVVGYPEGPLGSLYRGMVGADGLDPDNLHRSQP